MFLKIVCGNIDFNFKGEVFFAFFSHLVLFDGHRILTLASSNYISILELQRIENSHDNIQFGEFLREINGMFRMPIRNKNSKLQTQ